MRRSRSLAAAVAAAALLATACSPDPQPTASPTPSPTVSCSTSTVADPCTPEKAKEEKELAAAVAASITAYDNFLAERNRLAKAGGTLTSTTAMKDNAAGPYLALMLNYLSQEKKQRTRNTADIRKARMVFVPGAHRSASPAGELTFTFCEDGRANSVVDSSGKVVARGFLIAGKLYTRQIDQRWKVWDGTAKEVASCGDV